MTDHERMAALNAFMCDYDFQPVTIGDSPFTLERPRKAFDFAPPEPGNVYTFPVPDKQEGDVMEKEKRSKRAIARLTPEQQEAIHAVLRPDESLSDLLRDYIKTLVEERGGVFPENAMGSGGDRSSKDTP